MYLTQTSVILMEKFEKNCPRNHYFSRRNRGFVFVVSDERIETSNVSKTNEPKMNNQRPFRKKI